MRVSIIHNPGSGALAVDGPELIAAAREAGHQVTYACTADEDAVAARLTDPGDLVAIAGGDGTIRNIATRLIGRDVPITLLPTGTANNIGRTLGIVGPPRDLIAGWDQGTLVPFDTGVVRGASRPYPLLEGMGFGPIAVAIAALSSLTDAEARADFTEDELRRDLKVLREVLADYPVHPCQVTLDGRDLSGDYILVEAMNIRSVGANVELAPDASVSDGHFDLILMTDDDRGALRDYLTTRIGGAPARLTLPTHRGRHVELSWHGSRVHIDDQVWPNERDASGGFAWTRDGRVELEVLVSPSALQVLTPALVPDTSGRQPASTVPPL
jgi:diacylglycerol kinase (ATP)